jgi:hypothetical protein
MKTAIILTIVILLSFSNLVSKPVLEMKAINSFSVAELPLDHSLIIPCITDSLIIFYVLPDSAEASSICYDYQGNKVMGFNIPEVIKNQRPFNINYLFGRKQLAVSIPGGIDFLSIMGDSLGHIDILDDQTWLSPASVYMSCAEYDSLLYFRFFRAMEAASREINVVTSSFTWLKEKDDGEMWPLRKISFDKDPNDIANAFPYPNYGFLFDTNRDKQMAYVEEKKDKYFVIFFADSLRHDFTIKRRKNDHLSLVLTGLNYIVLVAVNADYKQTNTAGIYDLKGRKVATLNTIPEFHQQDDEMMIADIVGNKVITWNYFNKLITIYEILLRN